MSVALKIGNQLYTRWTSIKLRRGLKQCASQFTLETPGELRPAIVPFQPCIVLSNGAPLLTGYIVSATTTIEAKSSRTQITGQSKTQDLVDCMPQFPTSQFNGDTLDAIARAIAGVFGIGVTVQTATGDAFADATYQRTETGFAFLERLARQRAVMLFDDESGNLILGTAGTARAPGALAMGQGGNIAHLQAMLSGKQRFSEYFILSQAGLALTGTTVETDVEATASDGGVPRLRPWAGVAETAALAGDAEARAQWEAAHRFGEAIKLTVTVPEWRVGDPATGPLWRINQLVHVAIPRLDIDQDLLIAQIEYQFDARQGKRTVLTCSPRNAFLPDPGLDVASQIGLSGIVPVAH